MAKSGQVAVSGKGKQETHCFLPSPSFFFFFFLFLPQRLTLFGRKKDRGRKRALLSASSLSKWPRWSWLGQVEAVSLELYPNLPCGSQGLRCLGYLLLRSLDPLAGSWIRNGITECQAISYMRWLANIAGSSLVHCVTALTLLFSWTFLLKKDRALSSASSLFKWLQHLGPWLKPGTKSSSCVSLWIAGTQVLLSQAH